MQWDAFYQRFGVGRQFIAIVVFTFGCSKVGPVISSEYFYSKTYLQKKKSIRVETPAIKIFVEFSRKFARCLQLWWNVSFENFNKRYEHNFYPLGYMRTCRSTFLQIRMFAHASYMLINRQSFKCFNSWQFRVQLPD